MSPAKSREGTFTTTSDGWRLRFARDLNHPVEKVWAALTETDQMKDWLSKDAHFDFKVGGRVSMNDHEIESTITAFEAPKLIEYGWDGPHWQGGTVRWELAPTSNGTRLTLTHDLPAMSEQEAEEFKERFEGLPEGWEPRSSTLAGWHSILDRLEAAVDGNPIADDIDKWRELNERYQKVGA